MVGPLAKLFLSSHHDYKHFLDRTDCLKLLVLIFVKLNLQNMTRQDIFKQARP